MQVAAGTGINQLALKWLREGVIENQYYLRLLTWLEPELKQIKFGEYRIADNETPRSLLTKLSQGKVIQYPFTIVEGTNSYQLLEQLKKASHLKQDINLTVEGILKQLNIDSTHIEGWFYPDTYHFSKGDSVSALLTRATQQMQSVLAKEWQNRAVGLPYKNPYEALIMASIIEKETALASERGKIAGVFVRRLNLNMRLGTDPTVIYGIGPEFNGDITYKDLRTRTPYNTYMIKGLPPTPIAMPGQASIHAALNPEEGDALYFVATGDGGHYFSATLEEHNQAVKRWLRKQK